jgi:APA family basic amino acid/polyamine antiporter
VNVSELTTGTGPGGIVAGAALVFFAFIGFDEVITLAEETRDPTRTIPRAVLLSLFVSTSLYVAVAVSSVSVLGADRLAVSATPLADVIAVVAGDAAGRIVAVGALVSTSSTVLLLLTAGARMVYGMGSVGDLPQILGTVHKRRTPTWALVTCVVVAVALVAVHDLGLLAEATDGLVYAIFLVVNSVVIGLRFRRPDAARPFRVAGAIGRFPVVPALAIVVTIAVGSQLRAEAMLFAGVLLGGAALAHLAGRSMTGSRGIRRSGS